MERSIASKTIPKNSRKRLKEPKSPSRLNQIQTWFGSIIQQPLQRDQKLPSIAPSGRSISEEAAGYIAPSSTLAPHERIEIYHKQYWWRLLSCLHENFPLVVRLFGYNDFNQKIGIPYLSCGPPKHWALCRLGESLCAWIYHEYNYRDKEFVLSCAEIDWAAQVAFWTPHHPPIVFEELNPNSTEITLQPHVQLFSFGANLFAFRELVLKEEVNYWTIHPFPKLDYGIFYFTLFRSLSNQVIWKEISVGEFKMLSYLRDSLTIQAVCDKMEQEPEEIVRHAEEQMPLWFRDWAVFQWLIDKNYKS